MKLLLKIFLLIVGLQPCFGYRILGIFPMNVRSHLTICEHLMRGLARRGHQVDVVSPFPNQVPVKNYTDITIPHTFKELTNDLNYERVMNFSAYNQVKIFVQFMGNDVCQMVLNDSKIQELINNPPQDPPYDLIIMEVSRHYLNCTNNSPINILTIYFTDFYCSLFCCICTSSKYSNNRRNCRFILALDSRFDWKFGEFSRITEQSLVQ